MSTATQAYQGNMSIADTAKEEESFRNLRLAQARQQQKQQKQKQQQSTQLANRELLKRQNIQQKNGNFADSGQMSAENKSQTDAQRKARLRSYQKSYKAKRTRSKRKKILIRKYNRWIKRYDRAPWVLMYAAAAGSIIGGLFTEILIGYLLVVPCVLFIDVMVWNTLNKKDKIKSRKFIVMSTAIKFIPIISMIPASLFLVYKTQIIAKKRKMQGMIKNKKINML